MRTLPLVLLTVLASILLPAFAHAQALPPDVVVLQNGGLVRGTIVENIPGDHVTIQLVTGEVRTFAAAEVVSAGAAPTAPPTQAVPAPPPIVAAPAPPPRATARVRVESNAEDFILHRVTATATMRGFRGSADAFDVVCRIPCEVEVEPGTYYLGLSRGTSAPTRWRDPFALTGDTTLVLDHEDRGVERLIGTLVLIGGGVVGAAILAGTIVDAYDRVGHINMYDAGTMTGLVTGGLVIVGAAIVGGYFAGRRDHVDLRTGSLRF